MRQGMWAIALGVAIGTAFTTRAGMPRIEFDKTLWDIGTTSQTQSVSGSFVFRNTGDATLKLGEPATTCGCIVASVSPGMVEAGKTGEVQFTLSMPSARSSFVRHIIVSSDDPKNAKVQLEVKGTFVPLFEIKPLLLQLEVRPGQTTNLSAIVARTNGKPLKIKRIEPTKPWIYAKAEVQKTDPTTAQLSIEVKPDGPPRYFTEWVRLYVDESDQPAVSAVLMGRVLGDLKLSPERLFWSVKDSTGPAAAQEEAAVIRRLTITSTIPGHLLELRNAASTLKEVQVELISREKGKSYDLVAKLIGRPKATIQGTLDFETNLPSQPTAQVPVTISVIPQ